MVVSLLRIPVLLCLPCVLVLTSKTPGQAEMAVDTGPDHATESRPAARTAANEIPGGLLAGDWSSIRAAHAAGSHAVHPEDGGYQARNPGQQWLTHFDGLGFSVEPDASDWTWGLELESYGLGSGRRTVTKPARISVEGQRIAYTWDTNLEEWYVNDSTGLEHGYTVHERPTWNEEGEDSPLILTLAVRGTLRPEVDADGRGVRFLDSEVAVALTYTGLTVFDADGQELRASFERAAAGLRLSIDEQGARYPLTIDPVAQQAYLKPSNTDAGDRFGHSVAVFGETVVVGAPREQSNATGVNGNQGDNSSAWAGAAYVFVRSGTNWSQEAYLKASNTDGNDEFGESVAVFGNTVVVGAPGEASGATGVNGDQSDNSSPGAGAVYVFVRSGRSWSQQAYLKASNTDGGDEFGLTAAVSGDTVVIGAYKEASGATGVNGDQSNNSAAYAGAAYVFVRSGTSWSQQAYLKASNTDMGDRFGWSASVSGDLVVIGASGEESNATGVNGNQSDNSASSAGAAYVFVRNGTSWSQEAYLKASNTDAFDQLGISARVSGDTAVLGALGEGSNATGVNGNQSDNSAPDAGAAYVFMRSGTSWSQQSYLKASNTDGGDEFGISVAVSGEAVVVGAQGESGSATGVNGNQSDNSASSAGAAYLFVRNGTNWSQEAYLKPSNTEAADLFGGSVAVFGDSVVVGAEREDSSATGLNGDQGDNSSSSAGAVYLFDLSVPGAPFCFGDPGAGLPCPCSNDNDGSVPGSGCANGVFATGAKLTGSGTASLTGDTLVLATTHLEPNNAGLYFQAENDLSPGIAWGDGLRCAGGSLKRLGVRFADTNGFSDTSGLPLAISIKAGNVSAGDTKYYQCWYRTIVNPPCGLGVNDFNTSNGYAITWVP